MRLTLTQAASEAGISKGTVSKALKAGRLSGERQEDGTFQIEPVELFRVFPRKPQELRAGTGRKPLETASERLETGLAAAVELAELRVKVEMLEVQLTRADRERETILERERATADDLRKRLDRSEERVLALTAQPTPQPAQEPPAVVEELRRRLEESEARNQALSAVTTPQFAQDQPREPSAGMTPPGSLRGFLGRLLGR
jgi:vacuolar-type H+-ATPase subunit H